MKSNKFSCLLAIAGLLTGGCGHYYGFGIKSDCPSLKFKQTDKSNICGEYEFESVLFQSEDNALKIILQHPNYPLPEPDILISQVGVQFTGNEPTDFKFEKVEIGHFDQSGQLISPSETTSIPASGPMMFYVVKYDRKSFPEKQVREKAKVEFFFQGAKHTITFDEELFWVKRVSKLSAAMSI